MADYSWWGKPNKKEILLFILIFIVCILFLGPLIGIISGVVVVAVFNAYIKKEDIDMRKILGTKKQIIVALIILIIAFSFRISMEAKVIEKLDAVTYSETNSCTDSRISITAMNHNLDSNQLTLKIRNVGRVDLKGFEVQLYYGTSVEDKYKKENYEFVKFEDLELLKTEEKTITVQTKGVFGEVLVRSTQCYQAIDKK